jgi:hypothetical protein
MKLYETYIAIEQLWQNVEDIISGETVEGADGLPVNPDLALDWIEDALRRIEDERDAKALNVACFIKNLRAQAEALKQEKLRLQRRQQAAERTVERLNAYLQQFVEPGTRIQDSRAAIGWRKSEAVVCSADPASLPSEYQRVKVEADLSAIRSALKAGEEIAGAALENRNSIQIR